MNNGSKMCVQECIAVRMEEKGASLARRQDGSNKPTSQGKCEQGYSRNLRYPLLLPSLIVTHHPSLSYLLL